MLILALAPLLLAGTALGQATVIGPAGAESIRPGWRMLNGRWVQPAGEFRFHEVVSAQIADGRLVFDIDANQHWRPKLISGRRVLGELLPEKDLWLMMYAQTAMIAPVAQRGESIVLFNAAAGEPQRGAAPRPTSLTIAPAGVLLRGVGRLDAQTVSIEYQAARDGRQPRLTVAFDDRRGFDITGEDFFQLMARR